jgi:hypothetical protein
MKKGSMTIEFDSPSANQRHRPASKPFSMIIITLHNFPAPTNISNVRDSKKLKQKLERSITKILKEGAQTQMSVPDNLK